MGINTTKTNNYFTILGIKETNDKEKIENAYKAKIEMINKLKVKSASNLDRTANQSRYEQEEQYIQQLESQVQEAYEQLKTEQGREEYRKRLKEQEDSKKQRTGKISQINPNNQKNTEMGYIRQLEEVQKQETINKDSKLQYMPNTSRKTTSQEAVKKKPELQFIPIYKGKMGVVPEKRKTNTQSRKVEGEER